MYRLRQIRVYVLYPHTREISSKTLRKKGAISECIRVKHSKGTQHAGIDENEIEMTCAASSHGKQTIEIIEHPGSSFL